MSGTAPPVGDLLQSSAASTLFLRRQSRLRCREFCRLQPRYRPLADTYRRSAGASAATLADRDVHRDDDDLYAAARADYDTVQFYNGTVAIVAALLSFRVLSPFVGLPHALALGIELARSTSSVGKRGFLLHNATASYRASAAGRAAFPGWQPAYHPRDIAYYLPGLGGELRGADHCGVPRLSRADYFSPGLPRRLGGQRAAHSVALSACRVLFCARTGARAIRL
jgi:hypothetical protein